MAAATWKPWIWAAAVAALAGWLVADGLVQSPALVKARRDLWTLPLVPPVTDQTTLAAKVMGAPFWGATAAARAATAGSTAVEDPRWRIAGLVGVGKDRWVLVEFLAEGKAPLRLRVGDRLPSGHRIVQVDEREICVQIESRVYRLGVERIAI